mmetsp:Transcript_22567/g.49926  ORF Transcript_22567/g.49926 Transcript_22567/m.49926 type:complete len:590 (+) Transcript_22567:89-1858(+)
MHRVAALWASCASWLVLGTAACIAADRATGCTESIEALVCHEDSAGARPSRRTGISLLQVLMNESPKKEHLADDPMLLRVPGVAFVKGAQSIRRKGPDGSGPRELQKEDGKRSNTSNTTTAEPPGMDNKTKDEIKNETKDNVTATIYEIIDKVDGEGEEKKEEVPTKGPKIKVTMPPLDKVIEDALKKGNTSNASAINRTTVEQVVKERMKEAMVKKAQELESRGEEATEKDLQEAANHEFETMWEKLKKAQRMKWDPDLQRPSGFAAFFGSMTPLDWGLLVLAIILYATFSERVLKSPVTPSVYRLVSLCWIFLAAGYNCTIYVRSGHNMALEWTNGYVLEAIFLIENMFVFHIIVRTFRPPLQAIQKALFSVVIVQIVFQMVFYIGLALWLRSIESVPYVLGVWLIYIGCVAALDEEKEDFDISQLRTVQAIQVWLGDRLDSESDSVDVLSTKHGKTCLTRVGLMTTLLLVADFLLEIDVTVTKIETVNNGYIAFSSSVLATFMIPSLFFVAQDLFTRYFALKYGISFILAFFGVQMLFHKVFTLSALASILSILAVLLLSILTSVLVDFGRRVRQGTESGQVRSPL